MDFVGVNVSNKEAIALRKMLWISVIGVILGTAGVVWALTRNVAPDAITKATEGYNTYTGELAYLTDGKFPGNDDAPGIFKWNNKGFIIFELPDAVPVSEVRINIGEKAGPYTVIFFLGAKLSEDGQTRNPEGEDQGYAFNYDYATHQWVSLKPDAPIVADYVQLDTMGSPDIYEVEILAEEGTSIQPASWGWIRSRFME